MENFHEAWKAKMKDVYADPTAELLPNSEDADKVKTPEDLKGRQKTYAISSQVGSEVRNAVIIGVSRSEIGIQLCAAKARDEEQLQVAGTQDKKLRIWKVLENLFGDQDIGIGQKGAMAMASYDQTGKLENIRLSGFSPDEESDKNGDEFLAVMSGDDIRDFVRDVRRGDRVGIPIPPAHFDIFAAAGQPLHIRPFERQDFLMIGRHPSKRKQVTAEVTSIDVGLDRLVKQEDSETDMPNRLPTSQAGYNNGIHRDVLSELPLELTPAELMRFIRGQIKEMSSVAHIRQIAARHF